MEDDNSIPDAPEASRLLLFPPFPAAPLAFLA
jgi:hypothetical protein